MTIHPSHFGCIKSAVLTGLRRMYIDSSCSNLGIGIKISNVSINPAIIDPNEGCFVVMCTFLLTHIIPGIGDKLKKLTKKPFYVFSFDDTEEKLAVRFEGNDSLIYTVTLRQYLDPGNELPIDSSVRFSCKAHPV